MDNESTQYVVADGGCSRGLVGCEFRRRNGSYDHRRQVRCLDQRLRLRVWDIVLKRSLGTAVRLHPAVPDNKIPTYAALGDGGTEIPRNGMGRYYWRGTFRYYEDIGRRRMLNSVYGHAA